jgi:hypothetical protein
MPLFLLPVVYRLIVGLAHSFEPQGAASLFALLTA